MVPKLGFLGAKNSNLNFWRENEESNSLVFLGHFQVFGVFWMPKPPQKVKKIEIGYLGGEIWKFDTNYTTRAKKGKLPIFQPKFQKI